MIIKESIVLIAGAIVYKKVKAKDFWLVVQREEESNWEIPTASVRRVESSVRAAIRTMQELGGIRTRVLAEAGRAGGSTVINGRIIPMRHLFYLMKYKESAGEPMGYHKMEWLDYAHAARRLVAKRDKTMLRQARDGLKILRKTEAGKKILRERY